MSVTDRNNELSSIEDRHKIIRTIEREKEKNLKSKVKIRQKQQALRTKTKK